MSTRNQRTLGSVCLASRGHFGPRTKNHNCCHQTRFGAEICHMLLRLCSLMDPAKRAFVAGFQRPLCSGVGGWGNEGVKSEDKEEEKGK